MKTIYIDKIEVIETGNIHVRFKKLSSDGDEIGFHRTVFEKDCDIHSQFELVNGHIEEMGFAKLPDSDMDKITEYSKLAWK